MIMDYAYEYTYQDLDYIIRPMNTKHAQLVTKPYTYIPVFLLAAH